MNNKDEALKMAIEALERYGDAYGGTDGDFEALKACEEALEQPAQGIELEWLDEMQSITEKEYYQEPVYFVKHPNGYGWIDVDKDEYNQEKYDEDKWKLYTHPHQWQR